ncbi:hypothetical protein [Krasilnikovia sp. M28-CT-15]|uniref:hypothetical protein n=1 Tax=Krasilnikovia sp. M28-CT-15 TaxID=3373540 RepID=UPI003876806C
MFIDRVAPRSSETDGWLNAPQAWYFKHLGIAGSADKPRAVSLDVIFVDNTGRRWLGPAVPSRFA